MTKISDAAKAAAVRMFCSNVGDYETGVDIFNAVGESHGPVDEVLERFGALRWQMLDDWPADMWWEQLEILAVDIDAAWDHFEFPVKQI
jgi:hypothetical protein